MPRKPAEPSAGSTRVVKTSEILVDTVIELMETTNPDDIRIEDVLAKSGVSSGSLYHHFGSFPGLIDQAIVSWYSADVDSGIAVLTKAIAEATDVPSLTAGLRAATVRAMHSNRAANRFGRAQVMARAAANQRFRDALLPHQERLTTAFEGMFRDLQARGLVDPAVDPVAGSLFVQSYNLGFVVNDVSGHPAADDAVVDIIMRVLERAFFVRTD